MNDFIMDRYAELSLLNVIPDMRTYAEDWNRLALQAEADGRLSTAGTCKGRAEHYRKLAVGEYIRLVDDGAAELIQT